MVDQIWNEQPQHYPGVMVDAFVVMPNHIHGIIILTDPKLLSGVCGSAWEPTPTLEGEISHDSHQGLPQRKPIDIPSLVGLFKSLTTKQYREVKSEHPQSRLPEKLWQRSFYERVIRSENDLEEKRDYILTNPLRQVLKSQKTCNP